jgi:hypothetical protein
MWLRFPPLAGEPDHASRKRIWKVELARLIGDKTAEDLQIRSRGVSPALHQGKAQQITSDMRLLQIAATLADPIPMLFDGEISLGSE